MIGFDRPLRPHWIYESLILAEPGQKLTELNLPFENIARELTGKEGKRKARTVLFRCFLRSESNATRARESLFMKELSEKGLEPGRVWISYNYHSNSPIHARSG